MSLATLAPKPLDELWVSATTAATALGCSTRVVGKLAETGRIAARREGDRPIRYRLADVLRLASEATNGPEAN